MPSRVPPRPALTLFGVLLLATAQVTAAGPWSAVATPSPGPAQVIGGAGNGCIGGARTLPETGTGYVSIRRDRHRYFAHPATLRMVEDLGRAVARRGLGLVMIGDLSQPRGGVMASNHASHQNGLDVDIWFTLAPNPTTAHRLMDDQPDPASMVQPVSLASSPAWGEPQRFLLETAARNPAVERIFVNPGIKRALCNEVQGERAWLRKVRPWWGHDAHFHVRLRCPPGSPQCGAQAALPPGDGCGPELAWWFTPEAAGRTRKKGEPRPEPTPPAACMAVLREP